MNVVSAIIPIYNVEKYLVKCLDSVVNQTLRDIEIICVNDCSPDNCLEILKEYAQNDKRIKIINREKNGGLSAARNSGLDVATGEYIYFLDSDDWIDLDYIEKMLKTAKDNDVDIVLNTNILSIDNNKETSQFFPNKTLNNYTGFINPKECIHKTIWNTWAHLWKKSFLDKNSLKFPVGLVLEDMYFQAVAFAYLDKLYITRSSKYNYRYVNSGIVAKLSKEEDKSILAHIKILDAIFNYYTSNELLNISSSMRFITPYLMSENTLKNEDVLREMQIYFAKISKYIQDNKDLYGDVELEYFYDVLNNLNKVRENNYKKRYVIQEIRKNLKK